ncbi:MAG TPA: sigma-70 family RNA polymerase sigma factor [Candidatus Paceibacterota bacterium]|jgi:RNA polymerase sigma-70 factor (ECF subfamily)|nr:sigma-70 family RNA polymerase sigma factor [Candidatus Paceibacterota bacterium]
MNNNLKKWPDGFGAIYSANFKRIFSYFFYRTGQDKDVAEDLTEETFLHALEHYPKFTEKGYKDITYLMAIAHNLLVNYYKKSKSIRWSTLEKAETSNENLPLEQVITTNEDELGDAIAREDLERALSRRTLFEKYVLNMKYVRGLSIKSIAKNIHRTVAATKLLLYRIRNKIRKECKDTE